MSLNNIDYIPCAISSDIAEKANALAIFSSVESVDKKLRTKNSSPFHLMDNEVVILSNSICFLKFKLSLIEVRKAHIQFSAMEIELLKSIEKFLAAVKATCSREIVEQQLFEVSSLWIKSNRRRDTAVKNTASQQIKESFFNRLMANDAEVYSEDKQENFLDRLNKYAKSHFGECFALFIK